MKMADTEGGGGTGKHFMWEMYVFGVATGLILASILLAIKEVVMG